MTNAVRHAGGPDGDALRVRIAALPGHVRVEVLDPSPGFRGVWFEVGYR